MANRYFVFSGVNYSTSLTSNWSTFSNGIGGASLPNINDSIYFDQYSPTCSADSTIAFVSNAYFTGYNKTFNFYTSSYNFQVNNYLTLSPSMSWGSYSDTSNLILGLGGWGTVSSNGATWSGNLVYHYKNNVVFNDAFINMGNLIIASNSFSGGSSLGLFKNSITLYGSIYSITSTGSSNNFGSYGTTQIYIKATQSVSVIFNTYSSTRFFNNPIFIQASSASGVTVSFSGTLNYTMAYNYPYTVPVQATPYPQAGIFYSTGNVDMSNFSYYYSNNSFDGNNSNVRYPLNLDLKNIFLPQLTVNYSLFVVAGKPILGYITPVRIASTMNIGTLSVITGVASGVNVPGVVTLYGGVTFSINNLYLDRYLYLGTTNSVYINNIIHTGTANAHSQIAAAFYGFNGTPLSYQNPVLVLASTYSTSYLDVVQITISQSSIYSTSSIILNSVNAYNTAPSVYFVGSASSNNWENQNNWSLSSGGPSNVNFLPDSGTTIFFDGNSGTCSLGITSSAYNLNFTGYKNSFTVNNALNIYGNNLIISPSMSFTGSGGLIINSMSASISTNNYAFSVPIKFQTPYLFYYYWYPNLNYNFNNNLNSNNSLIISGQHNYSIYNQGGGGSLDTASTFNFNNNIFYIKGNYSSLYSNIYGSTYSFGGTKFSFDVNSVIGVDVLINSGADIFTMSSSVIIDTNSQKTWKYISGTTIGNDFIFTNNGTFSFDLNSSTNSTNLTNTSGLNIGNITATSNNTNSNFYLNLISPLNITKTLSIGVQSTKVNIVGSTLYCGGTITFQNYSGGSIVVDKLTCYGTGSIWKPITLNNVLSGVTVKDFTVANNSILSMSYSGAVVNFYNTNMKIYGTLSVIGDSFYFKNTTSTSQSSLSIYGGVNNTNGPFLLSVNGTVSIYTPNTVIDSLIFYQERNTTIIPQNNLQITNLRSDRLWNGNYYIAFTGSYGFNASNFYHDSTANTSGTLQLAATYIFNNGITYSFNNLFNLNGSYLYTNFLSANTASNPAKLILNQGTKINANYLNLNNIDCSSGLTLRYFKGTSTNSPNTLSFNTTDFLPIINSGMS